MKHKLLVLLTLLFVAGSAHAATGGAGLPWETPLQNITNSLTGPVAYYVSLLGVVVCGGMLIFAHGHINEFVRGVFFVAMVIAIMIVAKNTLQTFGFAAGSTVTESKAGIYDQKAQ